MGGTSLDLHRLFVEVTSRGGIEKVWSFNVAISLTVVTKCLAKTLGLTPK